MPLPADYPLPGAQQVDLHHREQQQGQDAETEAGDLEHGPGGAPGQGRETQAPDPAGPTGEPTGETHQHQDGADEGYQRRDDPGEELPGQLRIAGLPEDEQGQGESGVAATARAAEAAAVPGPGAGPSGGHRARIGIRGGRAKPRSATIPVAMPGRDRCQGGGRQVAAEPAPARAATRAQLA